MSSPRGLRLARRTGTAGRPEWSRPAAHSHGAFHGRAVPRRAVPQGGPAGRALRLLPRGRGFRAALRHSRFSGAYVPDAVACHAGSATLGLWSKETVRLIARNQVLLVAKHYPARYLWRYGWPILAGQSLWGLLHSGMAVAWPACGANSKLWRAGAYAARCCAPAMPRGLSKIVGAERSGDLRTAAPHRLRPLLAAILFADMSTLDSLSLPVAKTQ